jgi:hypothetical protein
MVSIVDFWKQVNDRVVTRDRGTMTTMQSYNHWMSMATVKARTMQAISINNQPMHMITMHP